MADIDKLIKLAFHPSAAEGEAINAFLALRRRPDVVNNINKSISVAKPVDKKTRTWNIVLPARTFDVFLRSISEYDSNPYFVLKQTKIRKTTLDSWHLELKVFLESNDDLDYYSNWLEFLFLQLKT